MGIKQKVKVSFLIISVFVIILSILNNTALNNIKKRNNSRNYILELIRIQDNMNDIAINTILSKGIDQLNQNKKKFTNEEKKFENLKKWFVSSIDSFVKDSHIEKDINTLYINEKKIEKSFDKIFDLQKKKIKLESLFRKKYPIENSMRKELQEKIWQSKNIEHIKDFADLKYHSKEALYQYRDKKHLQKWFKNTLELQKDIPSINFNKYIKITKELSNIILNIENIKIIEKKILANAYSVVKMNRELNDKTLKDSSRALEQYINKQTTLSFFISIIIVLFIIYFAFKVYKNVGLSVDEIEEKVKKATKEIRELNKEIEDTQKEVVFTMGAIGESRSKETGNHVKRVAEYSKLLALYYGLDKKETEILKQASPMHDIGKVAIPDAILNKPGRFNEEERKIMNTHAKLGYDMLKHSNRALLKTAAIVAHEHHEKWDGTGYPRGLKGEEIHIYGRITAVADVFDALGSDRCYKKAWDDERIFKLFKEEKDKHFDPKLVDIFFKHLDEFLKIREKFKDNF